MKRFMPHLLVFFLVAAAYLGGFLKTLDLALTDLNFSILQREASQQIVVVEIDVRSLKTLDSWPWPRRYHAAVIERLIAAGADAVALDIDFSSRSNPVDDEALRSAIARSGNKVVLPIFKQYDRGVGDQPQIIYSSPHPAVDGGAVLATVNVQTEPDGRVRRYLSADDWKGRPVTSMAGRLATGRNLDPGAFHLDLGIDPRTVPRLSYTDVLDGNFLNETVAGKKVIVGATALELGDQLAVAVHKIVPGPVLQAIAFESLFQGRAIHRLASWPVLAIALLLAVLLGPFFERANWRVGLGCLVAVGLLSGATSLGVLARWPVIFDTVPWVMVAALSYTLGLWRSIDAQSVSIFQHRLDSMHRRAMMQSVVDDSFDGIAIVGEDTEVELINPAGERILGVSADDVTGERIHDFLPRPQGLEIMFTPLFNGRDYHEGIGANVFGPQEIRMLSADGNSMTIELIVSSSRLSISKKAGEGGSPGRRVFIYTFRDITERKQAEEAQNRARETAEAANRAKTEFLANMSHELRTPLNAVIGFSDIIMKEALGPAGVPQYVEYAHDINTSGTHLLEIINDILDMSKIEAGELEPNRSEFDFGRVVLSSLKLISGRAGKEGLEIVTEIPDDLPVLTADERMIKQILINLLANAVKFTPAGGTVTVSAMATEDGFSFSVADTGIGIPEDKMSVILEPFGQADSRLERVYEGTGLGLPLVKSMTELHGGRLEIASTEGVGTTATVSLPADCILSRSAKVA